MGNQIDLVGPIIAAIMALPGVLIEAYAANPGPWNQVGLMMLGLVLLGWLASRVPRRRGRPR
ncbi:hypothetical protein [Microbacterium sp. LWH3-1.2]|uniref:hypothetical protein n=1 Tax=Microbacterium sp. LWH3-1.2 TaxID=3135256 RepID=UPI003438376D